MSSKSENLEKIRASIFKDLMIDSDEFYDRTPIEKLKFIENAFYKVNHYFRNVHFGLQPKNTKFGFYIGCSSDAITFAEERGVGVNITEALLNLWPYETYQSLFHEMQHVWNYYATPNSVEQRNTPVYPRNEFEKFLAETGFLLKRPFELIEDANLYTTENYDLAHHAGSPNEMFANNSMFIKINRILREGMQRTTDEKGLTEAKELYSDNRLAWKTCNSYHLKAVANLLSGGRLFADGGETQLAMDSKQGEDKDFQCLVLSTHQAAKVIADHPEIFSDWKTTEAKGEETFYEYIQEDGEIKHVPHIYFGEFNLATFKRDLPLAEYAHFDQNGNPVDPDENSRESLVELNELYKSRLAELQSQTGECVAMSVELQTQPADFNVQLNATEVKPDSQVQPTDQTTNNLNLPA